MGGLLDGLDGALDAAPEMSATPGFKAADWGLREVRLETRVDAKVHAGVDAIRQALVQQLYRPVQWTGCVQALAAQGVSRVAECGPGKVLSGMVKRIDAELQTATLLDPASLQQTKELLA